MNDDSSLQEIRDALRDAGCTTSNGRTWTCPSHNDRVPSLAIDFENGRVLIHCFAGCSFEEILDALELPISALFDE